LQHKDGTNRSAKFSRERASIHERKSQSCYKTMSRFTSSSPFSTTQERVRTETMQTSTDHLERLSRDRRMAWCGHMDLSRHSSSFRSFVCVCAPREAHTKKRKRLDYGASKKPCAVENAHANARALRGQLSLSPSSIYLHLIEIISGPRHPHARCLMSRRTCRRPRWNTALAFSHGEGFMP
jgi:hypothetical protein